MPQSSTGDRTRATPRLRHTAVPAQPLARRRVLRIASGGIAALAATILAGCDKPYYDRDRGAFVFRRHDK